MEKRIKYFINSMALMVTFLLLSIIDAELGIYQKTFPNDYWLSIILFIGAVANGIYGLKALMKKEKDTN